jgi:hypothetical protein
MTQDSADAMTILRTLHAIQAMEEAGLSLLFDNEGRIIAEYARCLENNSLGRKIYIHAMKANMMAYYSGSPTNSCSHCLASDGFDPSDIPYVAVATRGGGAYVTHEAKHLDPARVSKVKAGCGIEILSTSAFFADLAV